MSSSSCLLQSSTYAKNNVVHYIDFEILNYSTELDSICDATTAVAPDNKCIRSFKICLTPLLASHKSSSSNNGQQQQLPTINRIGERVSRARFNYFTGTHQSTADVNPFYDERKKLHRRVNTGTFTSSSSSSFASPSSSSSFNVPPVQSIGGTSKSKSSTSSNIRPSVRSKINVTPYHIKYHSITSSASSSNWSALGTNVVTSSPNVSTVNTSTSTSSISNVNPSIVTTSTPVSLINDTIGDNKQSYLKSFFNKILGTIKAAQSLSSYVIPSSTAGTFSSSSTSLSNDSLDGNASVHNHYGNQCSLAHWFTPVSNASMSNVSSSSSSTSSFTSSSPVIVLRTKVPTALLASLSYLNNIGNKRYSSNNLASVITRSRARFNPTIQSVDPVKILINIEVWQENFAQLNSSSSSSSPSFDHNNNSENSSHHQVNNNYSSKSNKEKTLIGKIHDELSVSLSPDTFSTDGWIQGEFINNKNLTHFYSLNSTSSSNDSLLYSNSYDIHEIVTQIHGKLIALKYRWKITEEIIPLNKDSSSKSPDNSLISTVYGVPGEITAGQGDTQTSDFSSSSSSSHVSSVTTSPVSFTSETTTKVTCPDGYTGVECKDAICTPGCHVTHGYCDKANECKCKFGWTGWYFFFLPTSHSSTSLLTVHLILVNSLSALLFLYHFITCFDCLLHQSSIVFVSLLIR